MTREIPRGSRGTGRGRGVRPPEEQGHMPADALAAELDARLAESTAAWRSRRDARRAARAEFKAARDAGLQQRHAAKLAHDQEDRT